MTKMKKQFLILILFSGMLSDSWAQHPNKDARIFSSQISTGILEGQQNTSFHIETLNGCRYKTWFGGIGVGLDYYYFRTVPVYVSTIKYLSPRSHSFYVQGDGGINFVWEDEPSPAWNQVRNKYEPGAYWNGAVGFVTGLDKKNAFLFGLGYSFKYLKQIRETTVFCINPPCENSVETYRYNLKRLTLKLGWQFNYSH